MIATSTYEDEALMQLRSPAQDAVDLASVLADPKIGGFAVTTLTNPSARDVRIGVEEFLADRRLKDLVLVYLSCHGVRDPRGRLYFAATDTRRSRLAATGVESRWVMDLLDECAAKSQVVILDCCFSGAFDNGRKGMGELDEHLESQGRGRAVLTASRSSEYSFEGEQLAGAATAGSVFTAGLVEGIRSGKADFNKDGYITVEEAYNYAYEYVQQQKATQTPQRWLYAGEEDIRIARNPSAPPLAAAELPAGLKDALESPFPEVRIGAVNTLADWLAMDPAKVLTARRELERIAETDIPRVAAAARMVLGRSEPQAPMAPNPKSPQPGPNVASVLDHGTWVRAVAFSPKERLLASAGDDTTVRLWDPTAGSGPRRVLPGHKEWVLSLAFSPKGKTLASGGDDNEVRLWDPANGDLRHVLKGHHGRINGVAFSPEANLLASASGDMTVSLWDRLSGQHLRSLSGHRGAVMCAAFSPDGGILATGSDDFTVRLWDPINGSILHTLEGHAGLVRSVAFNPKAKMLASAGDDGTIRFWDPASGEVVHVSAGGSGPIRSLAFNPQASTLAAAGDDGSVTLWNPVNGQLLSTINGHRGWVNSVAFSADGNLLASAGKDKVVRLWRTAPGHGARPAASPQAPRRQK